MFELRALEWPADRDGVFGLDTSYPVDRRLRVELASGSVSLVEEALPARVVSAYSLTDIVDTLADFAWAQVACDGPNVVGVVALAVERWNRRARLEHVYVTRTARGCGVGRALVEAAVGAAELLGARGVWVETQTTNVGAVRFYERAGFEWCGLDSSLYDPQAVTDGAVGLFFWRAVGDRWRTSRPGATPN